MTYKFALAAFAACLALSACNMNSATTSGAGSTAGGSTGGGSTGSSSGTHLTSTQAQNVAATSDDYLKRINNNTLTTTTPSGTATMAGYYGVSGINPQDSTTTGMGKLNMNVDFTAGSVGGSVSDIGIYNGSPLTDTGTTVNGSLTVKGTVSGSGLSATATGQLTDSGSSTPSTINTTLTGKFYDDAGTLTTVGDVSGTMTQGSTTNNLSGNFYATKQ